VDWNTSYSLYADQVGRWFAAEGGPEWPRLRGEALELLRRGRELQEIAGLIGPDALQDADRHTLDCARIVQEIVLGQSAYDPNDASSTLRKTYRLVELALALYRRMLAAAERGARVEPGEFGPVRRALAAVREAAAGDVEARAAEADGLIAGIAGGAA